MRTLLIIAFLPLTLFAGGPLDRSSSGEPSHQDTSKTLVYSLDPGELNATYSHAQIKAWVLAEFNDWQNIPGTMLTIEEGAEFSEDITSREQVETAALAGLNPIAFDETGSIFEDYSFQGSGVLAFASIVRQSGSSDYAGMFAVIGGAAAQNSSERAIRSTILHELGHGLGLGHSVVGGALFERSTQYAEFGTVPSTAVETMYFRETVNATHDLKQDEISAYLELYGNTAQGNAQSGAIAGNIYMPDGGTPANGVNVIVHDRSGDKDTVFVNSASTISWGTHEGRYQIVGLPPGEYSVEVYDIGSSRGGRYSEPIRTDFANNLDPDNTILGTFPGDVEFYNTGESHRPDLDDPVALTTVTVTAGSTVDGIDIIFNREANVKGTEMPKTYHVPEVQTSGGAATYVGIVNPNDYHAQTEITGFAADGEEIRPDQYLVKIPALGKLDLDVATWFGARAGDVAWLQVGGPSQLYVYAELQTPETRGAWWANDGLNEQVTLPHVAKDTGSFETVISSVNGKDEVLTTNLVSKPDDVSQALSGHQNPFGQASTDLLSLFGDLNPIDWARLESDGATASMEYFVGPPDTRSQMAALGLTNESGTLLRFLHIANNLDLYWTGLVYINTSDVTVTATETFYNNAGAVVATVTQILVAGQKVTRVLRAGLDPVDGGIDSASTWMEVSVPEESGAQLVGYELFSTPDPAIHDIFTGLQGNYGFGTIIDYPHFQSGSDGYTAIVATNVGDVSANLTVDLMGKDGSKIASKVAGPIDPKSKLALVINASFFGVASVEDGAWIRATSFGSQWAGFTLWGDSAVEPEVPKHLSGINAALGGSTIEVPTGPVRQLITETEDLHNSYASAMALTPTEGIWNINVLGQISQHDPNDQVVNTPFNDGIEDIYTFTLEEATALVIAANPATPEADLDLIVVNTQMASGNFYPDGQAYNPNLDFSASFAGLESVARVFQPGTYYILVTHFVGDTFQGDLDYGLLLTAHPLMLNTFEAASDLSGWSFSVLDGDSNGSNDWFLDSFLGTDFKYGSGLLFSDPDGVESSAAITPPIPIPGTGITVFDFDYAGIGDTAIEADFLGCLLYTEDTTLSSSTPTYGYNLDVAVPSDITTDDGVVSAYSWLQWNGVPSTVITGYTFAADQQNQNMLLGIGANASSIDWLVDNLRVYNMVTSNGGSKNKTPGRIVRPNKKSKKPQHAKAIGRVPRAGQIKLVH